jgi:hypothetical protein
MSDVERTEEELEIEAHGQRLGANEEPSEDEDDAEFEAHVMKMPNVRMD